MAYSVLPRNTAGIILAAGTSTRFGRPKQLVLLDRRPLLARVVDAALESNLDHVVLVLGHRAAEIKKALTVNLAHSKLSVLVNSNYHKGMAGSLKMAVKRIRCDYGAVMIILGDHPFVDSALINYLLSRFGDSDKAICVPTFKGRRGHPVCLSQRYYPELLTLSGDIGAREILRENPTQLLAVELDNDKAFMDVDTKVDLERAIALGDLQT